MNLGDYVRYVDVFNNTIKIRKINKIIPPDKLVKANYYYFNDKEGTIEKNIIKSSPQIIDLIEVGDYVNGTIVTKVVLDSIECNYIELDYSYNKRGIRNKDIKTVVTHEQMETMQYRVEE